MKKILFLLFTTLSAIAFGQLTVNNTLTPQQLVQNVLAGSGVTISNVTFNGTSIQIGEFGGNSNVGFNSGVILSTGNVSNAIGPNDSNLASDTTGTDFHDDDLDIILAPDSSRDAAILEFDFIPISDTIKFDYVFASEEYLEFVNDYNDVFGFFISGPGINGTFSNNAVNIALIPGTTSPVSIANINDVDNSTLYIDNGDGFTAPFDTDPLIVRFDGLTVPLQAISAVQCGQTYHLKLVIADANDQQYDSGVFLQAGSLSSNGVNINLSTVTGDTIIYEECTDANFIFTRPQSQISETFIVNYTLTGTADANDYEPMTNPIVFLPNEDTVIVSMHAIQDGVLEGNETVIITATFISECGDVVVVTQDLTISEEPIFAANTNAPEVFCPNDSVPMIVEVIGGTPPYSYLWSNGAENNDTVPGAINGLGSQTYTVTIEDFCEFTFQSSVTITQSPPPPMFLVVDDVARTCIEDSVEVSAFPTGGVEPLVTTWSNGGTGNFVYCLTATNPTYTITVTDDCGNQITEDFAFFDAPDPIINLVANDVTIFCGSNSVPLTALASNGFAPYTYTWSNGASGTPISVSMLTIGSQNFDVTATDNCGNTATQTLTLTLMDPPPIDLDLSAPLATCIEDSVLMTAVGTGGSSALTITWSNGQTGTQVYGLTSGAQTFTATATDDCFNSVTETITIIDAPDPTVSLVANDVSILCPNPNLTLSALASNGFSPYSYTWSNGLTGANIIQPTINNGTVNLVVTATDVCGNFATENVSVVLNHTLSIDALTQNPSVFCTPTGLANAVVSGVTGTPTYVWKGPGINGPIVSNTLNTQNLTSGTYFFSVIDQVCADSGSVLVEILDPIVASFTTTPITSEIPLNVTFFNNSQNATSYDWDFGNGEQEFGVDISNQESTYDEPNTFMVTLYAHQGICIDSTSLTFTILPKPTVFLPNIYTPNGDNINDEFTLAPTYFAKFSYTILNRWGNVMFEGTEATPNWSGFVQNGNLAEEGTYFYFYSGTGINGDEMSGEGIFQIVR
ncbi:MAG: choice-of-anchor L domain-containing protein [Bacteroidota bacterium]